MENGDLSDASSEEWSDISDDSSSESDSGTGDIGHVRMLHNHKIPAKFHDIFYQLFGFLVLWQAVFNISSAAISAFTNFFKYFVLLLGRRRCDSPPQRTISL